MWWHFKKYSEDETRIVYSYGYESHNQTGYIAYDLKTNSCILLRLAEDSTEFSAQRAFQFVHRLIANGVPVEKQFATG